MCSEKLSRKYKPYFLILTFYFLLFTFLILKNNGISETINTHSVSTC